MAMRSMGLKKSISVGVRCIHHAVAKPPPLGSMIIAAPPPPPMILPEHDTDASLDLMAVPKQKISKHKKRIRNGPKFLKPAPVIVRCTVCGRVSLPHFFCCSGIREENTEQGGKQ